MNPLVVGVPQMPTAAASKPRVPADAVPSQSDTPPHLVLDARRSLITYISQVQLDHDGPVLVGLMCVSRAFCNCQARGAFAKPPMWDIHGSPPSAGSRSSRGAWCWRRLLHRRTGGRAQGSSDDRSARSESIMLDH